MCVEFNPFSRNNNTAAQWCYN